MYIFNESGKTNVSLFEVKVKLIQKMTGGTPEVRSDKRLTLLTLDI